MKKNHDLVLFEVISVNHIRNREYGAHWACCYYKGLSIKPILTVICLYYLIDRIEADWEFDDDRIEAEKYGNHTIVSNLSFYHFWINFQVYLRLDNYNSTQVGSQNHTRCHTLHLNLSISLRINFSCLIFILCSCLFANAMFSDVEISPTPTCIDSKKPNFLPHRRVNFLVPYRTKLIRINSESAMVWITRPILCRHRRKLLSNSELYQSSSRFYAWT